MPDSQAQTTTGLPTKIDTSVAHEARVYDYWLGGKDNYPADRVLGDAIGAHIPAIRSMARANRAFLGRAVRHLVGEAGISQFLGIGTGIPTAGNTHEVAQHLDPHRAGGLRRQRSHRPRACQGTDVEHAGGQDRVHPRGPTRADGHPARRRPRRDPRLRRARRDQCWSRS
jgi:hypothetical protein